MHRCFSFLTLTFAGIGAVILSLGLLPPTGLLLLSPLPPPPPPPPGTLLLATLSRSAVGEVEEEGAAGETGGGGGCEAWMTDRVTLSWAVAGGRKKKGCQSEEEKCK